jgi:hypothetical protein
MHVHNFLIAGSVNWVNWQADHGTHGLKLSYRQRNPLFLFACEIAAEFIKPTDNVELGIDDTLCDFKKHQSARQLI